jgi:ABC-2 type transport system ATP-binding protein
VQALDDCSFTVERGRMLGFLGPNGAGKTTAMRAVFGLIRLDAGAVLWDGRPVGLPERLRLGYMPEERGLYPRMPVGDQLEYFARLHGLTARAARAAVSAWLDRLGIGDRSGSKVEELSHGNQQRAQLAAALVHEPELLVLDEPFAGLDPINQQVLKEIIVHLSRSGTTVIFSTHQMDVAEKICDYVCIIARGRKVLDGGLAEVKRVHGGTHVAGAFEDTAAGAEAMAALGDLVAVADDSGVFAELKLKPGVDPQTVLQRLMGTRARIRRFERIEPSLHRIFLDKAGPDAAAVPAPEVAHA